MLGAWMDTDDEEEGIVGCWQDQEPGQDEEELRMPAACMAPS